MADGLKFRPIASNRAPYISVESEPGCGTTFRIGFPRTEARLLETGIPDEKQADLSPASGRILLVEDNPEIRRLFHNTFAAAGFQLIIPRKIILCLSPAKPSSYRNLFLQTNSPPKQRLCSKRAKASSYDQTHGKANPAMCLSVNFMCLSVKNRGWPCA
jgi:hypothetical protein